MLHEQDQAFARLAFIFLVFGLGSATFRLAAGLATFGWGRGAAPEVVNVAGGLVLTAFYYNFTAFEVLVDRV